MSRQATIEHEVVITGIQEKFYEAEMTVIASCAACQMKRVCSVSETDNRNIIVQKKDDIDVKIGDRVTVFISQSKGLKAVFWGYVMPFLCMFLVLIIVGSITKNDAIAGISAILTLVPYYFVLYLVKDKINEKYKFHIKS